MIKYKALLFAILILPTLITACADSSVRSENFIVNNISLSEVVPSPTASPENEDEKKLTFDEFAKQQKLPSSEDFSVSKGDMFLGTPVQPIFREKRARYYRTVLCERAERGPNFAGHYTIATWGAGLGTFSIAVIDARTGRIFFAPFESVSRAGFGFSFAEGEPEMNPAFRIDSKLFAFTGCPGKEYEGCPDWDKDGFYLYSFNNGRFKLVRFVKRDLIENALKN